MNTKNKNFTLNEALLRCCTINNKTFQKDKKISIASHMGTILVSYKNYEDLTNNFSDLNDLKFSECEFKYDGYVLYLERQDLDIGKKQSLSI